MPRPRSDPFKVNITYNCISLGDCQSSVFPSKLRAVENGFVSIRMYRTSKSFHALALGWIVLVGGSLGQSVSAQDGKRSEDPRLGASEVAFEWQYSCTGGKACSFTCPGSGGASSVNKLTLQLGSIALGGDQRAFGVFYQFSTAQIPQANGFSLTTGISTLSCQVNGMDLDYSGPRKSANEAPAANPPGLEKGPQANLR